MTTQRLLKASVCACPCGNQYRSVRSCPDCHGKGYIVDDQSRWHVHLSPDELAEQVREAKRRARENALDGKGTP